jgi:Zn-dependent metalloprotease
MLAAVASGAAATDSTTARVALDARGAVIETSSATGTAHLVTLPSGSLKLAGTSARERAADFFARFGAAFGIKDASRELSADGQRTDRLGHTHLSWQQVLGGVPVHGGAIRAHFDPSGSLTAVNGTFVPGIDVDTRASLPADRAETIALASVAKGAPATRSFEAVDSTLLIHRSGLVRRTPGADHLVWQVEVHGGPGVRELVFVDAHDGAVVDRISLTEITRVVYEGNRGRVLWREGDPLPYSSSDPERTREVNDLVDATLDIHDLYLNLSGGTFRSWDGTDATFHAIRDVDTPDWCPNASWDGRQTNYCAGMASDDVIAHEWTHAYTDRTHDLIYQWQPGALNEAFSDIFGEIADLLNGSGRDVPGGPRTADGCSSFGGGSPPSLQVPAPSSVAGTYQVGGAVFNPSPPWTVSGELELVAEAGTGSHLGCNELADFTPGRIAVVDRGSCLFREKAELALAAGATGMIVVNNQGDGILEMGGSGPRLTIPSVLIGQGAGEALKQALASGVTATMSQAPATDASYRWLVGEDTVLTVIRDMWHPVCVGDPGKVSDAAYVCTEDDNGGVHSNSGVPNHAFALLVDGGAYNGLTVEPIGLTRAAHLYWRAMSVYQVPTTGFVEHADLLELSCRDLVGAALTDLVTGAVSQEVLTASDCDQVAAAMAAVEMRRAPDQCQFQPMLEPVPPFAPNGVVSFVDDFDDGPGAGWQTSRLPVFPEFRQRDWVWTTDLPDNRSGGAWFAIDPTYGDCVGGSDDQSGVLYLTSPPITLAEAPGTAMVVFDHYLATEAGWDGGNVKLSVNGGPFRLIQGGTFRRSPYPRNLQTASDGNTNPLAGEPGFTGSDGGSVTGSWGQSRIDLTGLAAAGDSIRLRFDFGVDGCTGVDGWYLDSLRVVTVSPPRRVGGGFRP